jgi:hypothetical protein
MIVLSMRSGDRVKIADLGDIRVEIDRTRSGRVRLQINLKDVAPISLVEPAPRRDKPPFIKPKPDACR